MSTKLSLGDRMKRYEAVTTNLVIPPRQFGIIRLDGKAFHTLTKSCVKPFDKVFASKMDDTALRTAKEIQGFQLGYVQSDEISLCFTDLTSHEASYWFDGQIQKIVSVAAGYAAAHFNDSLFFGRLGVFDARVFALPTIEEVANYFLWRYQDCVRNSISGLAQAHFSHKQLHKKSQKAMLTMLEEKQVYWNEQPDRFKNGCFVHRANINDVGEVQNSYPIKERLDYPKWLDLCKLHIDIGA